jgi:ribosome-binding factor A
MNARPERVADQIREQITTLLAREVKDPGIGFLTVTRVKVTADLQHARIYYTALTPGAGDEAKARRETAKALERVKPFLRRQIAQKINLRRAPELEFHYDETIGDAARIEELLQGVREERRQYELANPEPDPESDPEKQ